MEQSLELRDRATPSSLSLQPTEFQLGDPGGSICEKRCGGLNR